MNTDSKRNDESEVVRQFLRYPLYFNSVYHKGYQFLIVSLAQKQALKNFTANNHLELTRRPLSKLAETRGSTPSLI